MRQRCRPPAVSVSRERAPTIPGTCRLARRADESTSQEWSEAWAAYDRGDGAQAGIVDQISFVVMRRLGITEAFTNDRHFQAAGFTVLF
jgi:predicted nucleic acid-binding protein